MTVQERIDLALSSSNPSKVIAHFHWDGNTLNIWNCAGEHRQLDFKHPQLRLVTNPKAHYLEPTGEYIQWGPTKFNPFNLCSECNLFHFRCTHESYLQRMIS